MKSFRWSRAALIAGPDRLRVAQRGAAQAADDRAVFDLLGRELEAAWLRVARTLDRRPSAAPLGRLARAVVALVLAVARRQGGPGGPG